MITNKHKIYLDMDGVISDWELQFKRYSGGVPVETYDAEHGKKNRFKFVDKNCPEYYSSMPWMKDGRLLYNFVSNLPVEIIDTINKLKEMLGIKESHRIYNSILNPEIWATENAIKPDVLNKLLTIANTFYKDTDLNVPLENIYFLGSTAGYNWTPTSDIDLHLVVDFSKIDPNEELVKNYVDGLKSKWNENHNIRIGNHPVEVYIQDIKEVNRSQAVYSLMKNEWVKKPKIEDIQIDKDAITKKYKQYVSFISTAIKEQNLDKLKRLVKRLYEMREAGLSKSGEYSTENLVFKLLRSTGYVNQLKDAITNITDKNLSK